MTIVAGTCKECGGDVMVENTRIDPNFHDCKCHGCGREVSLPWSASVSVRGQEIAATIPDSKST